MEQEERPAAGSPGLCQSQTVRRFYRLGHGLFQRSSARIGGLNFLCQLGGVRKRAVNSWPPSRPAARLPVSQACIHLQWTIYRVSVRRGGFATNS